MSKPVVVSIPHNLGKDEAMRRLKGGLGSVKSHFGHRIASVEERWTDDRMVFHLGAMGQTIDGHLDVLEDRVLVEVKLPWILAVVAEKAKHFIHKQGILLLEKK